MKVDNGPLRVLGIDPGLTRMGYGVVQETRGSLEALTCGTLTTSPTQSTATRLMMLFEQLRLVIADWRPEAVACERLFFAANASSAVPAMQASGIALLLAAQSGLIVTEYTPLQVKQAVVGNGNATKKQVQYMVERLVGGFPQPDSADAADALGVAITHLSSRRMAGLEAVR
ncbi:MAG TPA: crossover junction endodeoxyribonuclease RuvC [Actinomycetota bacterium]|nr:crossover junction endodeoxyribonuclease RuvC [Actinomycetota bacterium]